MAYENPEPVGELSDEVREVRRAVQSLIEELEAVDGYTQRASVCNDPALKEILEHNRDDEKDHAAMLLEWLRLHDREFDKKLWKRLFKT